MLRFTIKFQRNIFNDLLISNSKYRLLSTSASKIHDTSLNLLNDDKIIIRSQHSNVEIPDISLTEYIFQNSNYWNDKPAITCGLSGRAYNYGTIKELNKQMAKALLSEDGCNVKQNDTIGLLLPNIPEFLPCICGALDAGIKITFANPLFSGDEILRQFLNANVTLIITIFELFKIIEYVSIKLPKYNGTIFINSNDNAESNSNNTNKINMNNYYDFKTLLAKNYGETIKLPEIKSNNIAVIPYSSGTTGLPKGVLLTHRNCIANIAQNAHPNFHPPNPTNHSDGDQNISLRAKYVQDTVLTIPPFFHIYGYNATLNANLYLGRNIVTIPKFTPNDYMNALLKYRPSTIFVVPSLLLFLATHPNVTEKHLESVRIVVVGAAAATEQLQYKFHKKCNRSENNLVKIAHGYGMSESSPVTLISPYKSCPTKDSSVGQLLANTEARIVSLENGMDLGPNTSGELYIRGPQVMLGYLNNIEATKETLDDEGWLHTGDVAYYDNEEFFYIIDRTKELIKVKGNQVSPTELENLILELPEVGDVAVTSIPDNLHDELPRAYVVLRPDIIKTVINEEKLKLLQSNIFEHVKSKTVKYKWLLGGIQFVNAIPRNPAGKVIRNQLKLLDN